MVCLTNLFAKYSPMPPKLNRKRALFVLTRIDEISAWEKQKEAERDTRVSTEPLLTMNIEFPGGALGSLAGAGDADMVRAVVESLRG